MKTEVKEKWIDALTSGEYSQTTDMLKDGDGGFCCLGVLCDLYIKSHKDGQWDDANFFITDSPIESEIDENGDSFSAGWDTDLPQLVMDWAGLKDGAGSYGPRPAIGKGYRKSLSRDNDCGDNFKMIAKTIRREF